MKRTSKKLISVILALFFTLSLVPNSFIIPTTAVEADNQMQSESKVFSSATLDDNFADNAIMIVLNKEETFKFRNYTIEDFAMHM